MDELDELDFLNVILAEMTKLGLQGVHTSHWVDSGRTSFEYDALLFQRVTECMGTKQVSEVIVSVDFHDSMVFLWGGCVRFRASQPVDEVTWSIDLGDPELFAKLGVAIEESQTECVPLNDDIKFLSTIRFSIQLAGLDSEWSWYNPKFVHNEYDNSRDCLVYEGESGHSNVMVAVEYPVVRVWRLESEKELEFFVDLGDPEMYEKVEEIVRRLLSGASV